MSSNDHDPNGTPEEGPKKPEWTPGRRLSRKGMPRARGEDLNAHAKVEARRKARRRQTRTPGRDDVARAALYSLLLAITDRPDARATHILRRITIETLEDALFDPVEARRVLDDMAVRWRHDWSEWVHGRAFRAWRDSGCQGERPEGPSEAVKIPRRPNGTMPWTYTEPRPPGSRRTWRRRRGSPDDAA